MQAKALLVYKIRWWHNYDHLLLRVTMVHIAWASTCEWVVLLKCSQVLSRLNQKSETEDFC